MPAVTATILDWWKISTQLLRNLEQAPVNYAIESLKLLSCTKKKKFAQTYSGTQCVPFNQFAGQCYNLKCIKEKKQ